ncbi:MAG TPA: DUF4431 domain-containing protein [Pyrinomonadaceae bacterium]|nr:DUF4431 domain-containing protein [Pyrinomonadaceae bacterium]
MLRIIIVLVNSGSMVRILALLVLFIAIAPSAFGRCLKTEPNPVRLDGVVYRKEFPGPPNYQSIREGDDRMRYWILRLNKETCVEGDDFDNTRIQNVRDIQLVFADDSFYKKYRALVKRRSRFRVAGTLFHQQSGYHVTKILISVKDLVPLRK